MTDRKEFAKLLYPVRFTNFDSPEYAEPQIKNVKQWLKENTPPKLFHYRKCSERNITALENNEIWGSSICEFNDSFECIPYFKISQLIKTIENELDEKFVSELIAQIKSGNKQTLVAKMLPPELLDEFYERVNAISEDSLLNAASTQFKCIVFEFINTNIAYFIKEFFKEIYNGGNQFSITCFSEINTSTLMWGHYTDSHKGFCVEYDFTPVLKDCNKDCADLRRCPGFMMNYSIAPVVYSNERYNATSGLYSIVMNSFVEKNGVPINKYYPDVYVLIKILLTKSTDWKYEKEWRLFKLQTDYFDKHRCITKLKPSAVYLGINMTEDNKQRIIKICTEQNIPCYQMIPEYFSAAYEIRAVEASSVIE